MYGTLLMIVLNDKFGTMKWPFHNKKLLAFTALVCAIYWFLPIFQQQSFNYYADRTNDHGGIFNLSISIFQSLAILSEGLAYFILSFCFLFSWALFYMIFSIIKNTIIKLCALK